MWLSLRMNGILCAYLRATEPEHAERRGDGVAAAFDRQLHDVLGVEVGRVRRERRAGRVLDALIDRQDRDVAGAAEPAGVEQRLQAAAARAATGRTARRCDRRSRDPGRCRLSFGMVWHWCASSARVVTEDRFDAVDSGARRAARYGHVLTSSDRADPTNFARRFANRGNSKSSTTASATAARSTSSSIGRFSSAASTSRQLRARQRVARREQRAAVLVGDDRDRIGAELLRLGRDLVLVHADERPEQRQRRHAADHRQVLERLRRHLADDVAGDERLAVAQRGRCARRCAASAGDRRRRASAPAPTAPPAAGSRRTARDTAASGAATASAASPARAPSPARRATGSDSCGSGRT